MLFLNTQKIGLLRGVCVCMQRACVHEYVCISNVRVCTSVLIILISLREIAII